MYQNYGGWTPFLRPSKPNYADVTGNTGVWSKGPCITDCSQCDCPCKNKPPTQYPMEQWEETQDFGPGYEEYQEDFTEYESPSYPSSEVPYYEPPQEEYSSPISSPYSYPMSTPSSPQTPAPPPFWALPQIPSSSPPPAPQPQGTFASMAEPQASASSPQSGGSGVFSNPNPTPVGAVPLGSSSGGGFQIQAISAEDGSPGINPSMYQAGYNPTPSTATPYLGGYNP